MSTQKVPVITRRRDRTEQEQLALAIAITDDSDIGPINAWLTLSKSLSIKKITLVHVCVPPWTNETPESTIKGKQMLAKMNTEISQAARLLETCRKQIQKLRPNLEVDVCLECGEITEIIPLLVKTRDIDQLVVLENINKKSWWRPRKTTVQKLVDSCPCVVVALPSSER